MIPSVAHFVWFGNAFPWLHALAIRSAAEIGGFERVVLHHDQDLSSTPWWSEVAALPGFESRRLDAAKLLRAVPKRGDALSQIYAELSQPAARANMVRAAILAAEGGVYLDLDTVTVRSFDDILLRPDFFCGEEHIAYPVDVLQSRNPLKWGAALAKDGLREVVRRLPDGWRHFRRVEGIYPRAVNNAVVGCPAGHPFVERLLDAMIEVPVERRRIRYELGTSLLQREVAAWDQPGLLVYPIGPGVSQQWFADTTAPRVDEVLGARTTVVHWYASVRTREIVPRVDPDWVRRRADSELLSALVARLGLL